MKKALLIIVVSAVSVFAASAVGQSQTIDRMTTNGVESYDPGGFFNFFNPVGDNDIYHMSDGTTWNSGAGSFVRSHFAFSSVSTVSGNLVFQMRNILPNNLLTEYIDYNSGSFSSATSLGSVGVMQIIADPGTRDAVLNGFAIVNSDSPVNYPPPRYKYLTSPLGSRIPFTAQYRLRNTTWDESIFDRSFEYQVAGELFFDRWFVPEPTALTLFCLGSVCLVWRR